MSKDELRPAVEVWKEARNAFIEPYCYDEACKSAAAIIEADRAEVARLTEQRVVEGIVAWLRDIKRSETNWPQHLANQIERGEHNHD